MIVFLLANWRWLVPSAVAAVLAGWLGVVKIELADLQGDIATQSRDAEKMRADISEANTKLANADAIYTRNLDEKAKHETEALAATASDFQRELSLRVRDAERRARGSCPVSSAAAGAGGTQGAPSGGDVGLPLVNTEQLQRAADGAERLKVLVRTCVEWAGRNGR